MSTRITYVLITLIGTCVFADTCRADKILIIESVAVRETKEGGKKSWDPGGGAPDLRVSVERVSDPAGEFHMTAPRDNRFRADLNRPAIDVDKNDVLEFKVLDEDVGNDDEIGTIKRKITAEDIKSGRIELSFDQVLKLVLRLE